LYVGANRMSPPWDKFAPGVKLPLRAKLRMGLRTLNGWVATKKKNFRALKRPSFLSIRTAACQRCLFKSAARPLESTVNFAMYATTSRNVCDGVLLVLTVWSSHKSSAAFNSAIMEETSSLYSTYWSPLATTPFRLL
jgi:hypothetical protein